MDVDDDGHVDGGMMLLVCVVLPMVMLPRSYMMAWCIMTTLTLVLMLMLTWSLGWIVFIMVTSRLLMLLMVTVMLMLVVMVMLSCVSMVIVGRGVGAYYAVDCDNGDGGVVYGVVIIDVYVYVY